jgi:phage shock protein A
MTDSSAAAGFDRMKNKVMRNDAVSKAKAEMAGTDSLDDKFARLEKEDEVERLLQEIKTRHGLSAQQ